MGNFATETTTSAFWGMSTQKIPMATFTAAWKASTRSPLVAEATSCPLSNTAIREKTGALIWGRASIMSSWTGLPSRARACALLLRASLWFSVMVS